MAFSAAADGATHCPAGLSCPVDPTKLSLTGIQFGQTVVAILAGVAAAIMPARRASRLNVLDALHYE